MRFVCGCKCHRVCHTCGRAFVGPNDFHTNCQDVLQGVSGGNYVGVNQKEPWPDKDVVF